jgi:hypothetical protein
LKTLIDENDKYAKFKTGSFDVEFEKDNLSFLGVNYSDSEDKYFIVTDKTEDTLVIANFHKTLLKKGWDKLSIILNSNKNQKVSPFTLAYLGGYLEGRLTAEDVKNFLENMEFNLKKQDPNSRILRAIKTFFKNVDENLYSKLSTNLKSEEERKFYYRIFIFYAQLRGLLAGINKTLKERKLSIGELLLIQADGEIPELMRYFNYKLNGRVYQLGDQNYFRNVFNFPNDSFLWERIMINSHCSAMIKILKDEEGKPIDLLSGHVAWTDYTETYRTYKQ